MAKQKQFLIASFLIGFAILAGLDQWTKGLVVQSLEGQRPSVTWNGVFEFYYSENKGAAFGMMQEKQLFLSLIAVLVLGAVAYLVYKMPSDGEYRPLAVCLMMIGTGAVDNMIGRVSQGYVVDFLYFRLVNFPIFNVVDCYVTIGAVCLVFLIIFYYKDEDITCFSLKKQQHHTPDRRRHPFETGILSSGYGGSCVH